jgi:hypothetical protein
MRSEGWTTNGKLAGAIACLELLALVLAIIVSGYFVLAFLAISALALVFILARSPRLAVNSKPAFEPAPTLQSAPMPAHAIGDAELSIRNLGPDDATYFFDSVYPLLQSRIPKEELRSEEFLMKYLREPVEALPRYFICGTVGRKAVGFLYASANRAFFNPFISYLVVQRGLDDTMYRKVTRALLSQFRQQIQSESDSPRTVSFLMEIADPGDTEVPKERQKRLARFRLFAAASEFIGFDLRLVDIAYFQPAISVDPQVGEVPLLLLVARERSGTRWTNLSRDDVQKFIQYVYVELYSPRYSADSATQEDFARACQALLTRVTRDLPDPVPLLDYSGYLKRFRVTRNAVPRQDPAALP